MEDIFILSVHTNDKHDLQLEEFVIIGKDNIEKVLYYVKHNYGNDIIIYLNKGYVCFDGYIVKGDFIKTYLN